MKPPIRIPLFIRVSLTNLTQFGIHRYIPLTKLDWFLWGIVQFVGLYQQLLFPKYRNQAVARVVCECGKDFRPGSMENLNKFLRSYLYGEVFLNYRCWQTTKSLESTNKLKVDKSKTGLLSLICSAAVLILLQAACTKTVTVTGTLPTPLVERIPANVGVYYSDEFKSFEHKEAMPESGTYQIDFGSQNLKFFRNLVNALFTDVTEVSSPDLSAEQKREFDAVLLPKIVKYGFLVPAISTLTFYEASIEYQIVLVDNEGNDLGAWKIVGYGKAEAELFGASDAIGEATMLAIRDGGARITTEVIPNIATLLSDKEL